MIKEVAQWAVKHKEKDRSRIKKEFDSKFMGWMLKLAAGDSSGLGGLPAGFDPSILKNLNMPGAPPTEESEDETEEHDEL